MLNKPNKKEKPSFCEIWEQQRKAGLLYHILLIGSCALIVLMFGQLIYLTAIQDYSNFKLHIVFVVISAAVGAAYWFINEARYRKAKGTEKHKK